ncbi:MAG TPA: hypothetical protein VJT54_09010 [Verrucomicrobiae bacterium]|nr:hypothetical protein [Verrucomicrobiae bacterium]
MKGSKLFIVAAAIAVAQFAMVTASNAQEFYRAFVSAVSISTNSNGGLTYHLFGNRDLIHSCASQMGLTNDMGLSVVYDRTADAIEVVSGTNDTVLCTPLTFGNGVSLSNTNGTIIQRLAFVSWEGSATANGTLAATEGFGYSTNNTLTFFSLHGQLQFAVPGDGTNAPVIYRGSVIAGSSLFDEFEQTGPTASPSPWSASPWQH